MRYSLLTQITLIGLSVVIFATVIKPMFATIGAIQDERLIYEDAVDKAQQFNLKLSELIAIRDSFREEDMEKLNTFMPAQIDMMQVMREIEAIFDVAEIEVLSIVESGETSGDVAEVYVDEFGQEQVSTETKLSYQDVTVTFGGAYEDMKEILELAERNKTILEVTKLTFGNVDTEGGLQPEPVEGEEAQNNFNFEMVFRVYGLAKASTLAIE